MMTVLCLSSTSDKEKMCEIVCRVPSERVNYTFLCREADVISLTGKCIVIKCFVCGDYDTILMETEKFSDNILFTFVWCWQSAWVFKFYIWERQQSTCSVSIVEFFFLWRPSGILFTCIHVCCHEYETSFLHFGLLLKSISVLYNVLYIKINRHYIATWSEQNCEWEQLQMNDYQQKSQWILI